MKASIKALPVMIVVGLLAGCSSTTTSSGTSSLPGHKASPKLAAEYNVALAEGYMKEGRMDIAQQKLALALKQAPNMALVHNELALYYERVGDNDRADQEFRIALRDAPGDPVTLNNYGAFLCRDGKYKSSLKYFTEAASNLNYSTPDAALANAGNCALMIPDKKLADEYFRRALAINPNMPQALWQLGLMAFEKGNYSLASGYLGRLVDTQTNPSPQVLWVAIETEWTIGERDTATRYGRELLKKYPTSEEAKKFIQLIGRQP